jgi:hypothetical protein
MMGKNIQEDGTSCISFRPSIWIVARCFQINDSVNFGDNYLLMQDSNDYDP